MAFGSWKSTILYLQFCDSTPGSCYIANVQIYCDSLMHRWISRCDVCLQILVFTRSEENSVLQMGFYESRLMEHAAIFVGKLTLRDSMVEESLIKLLYYSKSSLFCLISDRRYYMKLREQYLSNNSWLKCDRQTHFMYQHESESSKLFSSKILNRNQKSSSFCKHLKLLKVSQKFSIKFFNYICVLTKFYFELDLFDFLNRFRRFIFGFISHIAQQIHQVFTSFKHQRIFFGNLIVHSFNTIVQAKESKTLFHGISQSQAFKAARAHTIFDVHFIQSIMVLTTTDFVSKGIFQKFVWSSKVKLFHVYDIIFAVNESSHSFILVPVDKANKIWFSFLPKMRRVKVSLKRFVEQISDRSLCNSSVKPVQGLSNLHHGGRRKCRSMHKRKQDLFKSDILLKLVFSQVLQMPSISFVAKQLRLRYAPYADVTFTNGGEEEVLFNRGLLILHSNNDSKYQQPNQVFVKSVLPESYLDIKENRLTKWQRTQQMFQDFWKNWSVEYLSGLQNRPKWNLKEENLKVGELVILKEDDVPPTKWLMDRVLEIHPGNDGLVRVVTLRFDSNCSILTRPIHKLCRLPFLKPDELNYGFYMLCIFMLQSYFHLNFN